MARVSPAAKYAIAEAVCDVLIGPDEAKANAARLAHCWNCHDELVEALKLAVSFKLHESQDANRINLETVQAFCASALLKATSPD